MARNSCTSIIPSDLYHLLIVFLLYGSVVNAGSIGHFTPESTDFCDSPIYCQGEFLKTIQLARPFNDSKTFVDHYQLNDPEVTLSKFDKLMTETDNEPTQDQIRQFIRENFAHGNEVVNWTLPDWQPNPPILKRIEDANFRDWAKDLNDIWKMLAKKMGPDIIANPQRHSFIPVPNGFIVPGGRFQEFYYWDSYWVVEGLLLTGLTETARGIMENFLSMVDRFGFIPNGGRVYYLMRSHPPLLTPMVDDYLRHTGNTSFLMKNLPLLEKEFQYFQRVKGVDVVKNGVTYKMVRYFVESVGPRPESYGEDYDLIQNVTGEAEKKMLYNDLKAGAESGWDFSSRWYMPPAGVEGNLSHTSTRSIIPVDLNAIMQKNARLLSEFNTLLGNTEKAEFYSDQAKEYQRGIDNVLWNEEEGIWLDWDLKHSRPRNDFYPTNICPLYTKSFDASKSQMYANRAVAYLKRNRIGDFMGGTPASLKNTGEQWDMPNAWAPLQSFLVQGLRNTGKQPAMKLSEELATRWLRSNYAAFVQTGIMFEKYNAEKPGESGSGGEYGVQPGFGWSNGAILEFLDTYPRATSSDNANDVEQHHQREIEI